MPLPHDAFDGRIVSPGAPARLVVGLVSAGRVGTAVAEALAHAGHIVGTAVAPSAASKARVAQRLPDTVVADLDTVARSSELLVLAVPDTELPGVVARLAASLRPRAIVMHTAGASGIGVLAPLVDALPLAVHPAMTFLGGPADTDRLAGTCFAVTAADEIGAAVGQALVLEMGGQPVVVAEKDRVLYHAALAHGSNHLVALVSDALDVLRSVLGEDASAAPRVLGPILEATLSGVLEIGPAALTGPVARGDAVAVARHLEALTGLDPAIAAGYRALARRAAARTRAPRELVDLLAEAGSPPARSGDALGPDNNEENV